MNRFINKNLLNTLAVVVVIIIVIPFINGGGIN